MPIWGPILSLLYLVRNAYTRQINKPSFGNITIVGVNDIAARINSTSTIDDNDASGLDVKLLNNYDNILNGFGRQSTDSVFSMDGDSFYVQQKSEHGFLDFLSRETSVSVNKPSFSTPNRESSES